MSTKAVIFDMDGVILQSEPLHDDAWCAVLVRGGYCADADVRPLLSAFRGRTEIDFFTFAKERFSIDAPVQEMIDEKIAMFLSMMEERTLEPMDGLPAVLRALAGAYPIALASSSAYPIINAIVDALDLRSYFDVIVSGEDVAHGKPAPDIFLLAAKRLGVEPRDCAVVEDSTNGIRAANSAGMRSIGFTASANHDQDVSEADTVIGHFDELLAVLH